MDFWNTLKERGFIHQCTDEAGLRDLLTKEPPVVAYIGFDCTAPSLHVGSLLQIMALRWLQKCGHKPIVLMGGGTTKIGDPSGKDESRPVITEERIAENMAGIQQVFAKYLDFETSFNAASPRAIMVNNADWLDQLGYIGLLSICGRHFSINRMLTMDSVKLRLEKEAEMTFLEFNYMIMQAYDFVELYRKYGCRLQIGGSDQWGNIVNGADLHRRLEAEKNQGKKNVYDELFGLTTPLLTTASGAKMGKTADGAVWLNADMTSPYDFWQYWRNTEDADVGRFLRLFTELPLNEIARLEALEGSEINEAKKILATAVTTLCHGEAAALEAAETAIKTFEQGQSGDALPVFEVAASELGAGIPAFKLFLDSGLCVSGGEARRLIRQGGAKVNGEKISDENQLISTSHLQGEEIKLSAGKKKHAVVRVSA